MILEAKDEVQDVIPEAKDEAQDVIPEQQPVAKLVEEGMDRIDVLIEDELQARMTQDEEFRAKLNDTNKELVHSAQDGTSADFVEAISGMENHTHVVSKELPVDTRLGLPEAQTSAMLGEETQEGYKVEETPVVIRLAETMDGGIEVANEDELEKAGITHDAEESRAKLIDTIEELVDSAQDKIGAELVETTRGVMGCKKALVAYESGVVKASEYLWKKGLASVEKGKHAISEAVNCAKVHVLLQVHQIDSDDSPNGCGNYRPFSCCRIYIIQDVDGRQWERSCRDLQIHHVQPD